MPEPGGDMVPPMRSSSRPLCLVLALACAAPVAALAADASRDQQVSMRSRNASVGGVWCGAGLLSGFTLEIAQQLDALQGKLIRKGRVRELTGHVEGSLVKVDPQRDHTMELRAEADQLRIVSATGVLGLAVGQSFTRAVGEACTR
jgi:hypothetical protein